MSDASIWGRRNPKADGRWEKLDLSEYKMTKPVVICLSGNGTTNDKDANAFCRMAQYFLGLRLAPEDSADIFDHADLIGVAYAENKGDRMPGLTDAEREQFIRNMLLKRCEDEKGNVLPLYEVCRNLSQITFFTFCYGSEEVSKICSDFNDMLIHEKGFTGSETDKIFESMAEISYSPYTDKCFTPKITALSGADRMNGFEILRKHYNFDNESIITEIAKPNPVAEQFFKTINIRVERMFKRCADEHCVGIIERDRHWKSVVNSKKADCVSQMVAYALARCVANGMENASSKTYKPKISMPKLLFEINTIRDTYKEESVSEKE